MAFQKHRAYLISLFLYSFFCTFSLFAEERSPKVTVGIDVLFSNKQYYSLLKNKRVGVITNHTGINKEMHSTANLFKSKAKTHQYTLAAYFAPEHGLKGSHHASELIDDDDHNGIPVYSLHGKTIRPTAEMLKNIDLLVFDIQDIGSRSYTYISTLFMAMEEAAKNEITVIVADRPNPINGLIVDGPMLDEKWKSIVGYLNVPYCHGMTIGELAQYFNKEYKINCDLHVVPMQGWKRKMNFQDTGLVWIPTSPHIPEPSTVYYYPTTGILGELQIVNIGVGYTLPFKLVGAPWINGASFAKQLNAQNFPGVTFQPIYYKPFYGKYKDEHCQGVQILITDLEAYQPIQTFYLLMGMLKSLYPQQFAEAMASTKDRKDMFCKVTGSDKIYNILTGNKYVIWPLRELDKEEREGFLAVRKKYLLYK